MTSLITYHTYEFLRIYIVCLQWLWAGFAYAVVLAPWTREVAAPRAYSQCPASRPEMEEWLLFYRVSGYRRDISIHECVKLTLNVHSGLAETNLF